ncbi:tetratricopeptide repeat-containing sensor histidine kinase [Sunxiuqinia sp. sy24]|uniref:tetratricopeptide repeat-containing sensor histidine kinase n=1 Tax=Sunxiuqinia sp. sy24 TaxID=3461495 RepID=UPI004045B179
MKKKVILFLLVFILSASGYSQISTIDSLQSVLDVRKENRLELLMEIADQYVDSIRFNDLVVACLQEAHDEAVSQKNDSIQVAVCNYLGLAYFTVGNYEQATNYFYQGLNLLDNAPNSGQQAKLYNNLGMIFDELEDYDRSLEFYLESFRLDSLLHNEKGLLSSYINLGISYQTLKEFDLSRLNYEKAYQLAQKQQDSLLLVHVLNNRGTLEYDLKNYSESLIYYQQALDLYSVANDREGVAFAKNNMGLVHLDLKHYTKARDCFQEALKIANDLDLYSFSKDVFGNLSIYYEQTGNYKKAFEYYHKYNLVYDSLLGDTQNKMIRKLETQYQFERKQREILELKELTTQQQELLSDTRNIQGYLYVIIILVVIFLAILFFLLRKEKSLARELQEKTKELKTLNVSKDRFFSVIAHDLKNPFNALVSYTNLLRFDFDSFSKEELSQIITDMNDASEQGFALLENLLYWTRSQTNRIKVYKTFFKLNRIVDDVISLANPNLTTKSQTVKVDIEDDLQVFADKDMIATVIRNLVFNSIKFSYANAEIRVEGKKAGNSILVSVIDQGVGIAADKLQRFFNCEENTTTAGTAGETGSGLGLIICREFIEKNDGLIWVESEVGKGATFRFSVPYVAPKK